MTALSLSLSFSTCRVERRDLYWLQVSRSAETGVSKGCGYVTMSSIVEAKAAIAALDGTVS